jgi:two-component system sensor histidine kinase VicK
LGGKGIDVELGRDDSLVELRVTDHGIGVPDDEVHRLTEPFYRSSRSRRHDLPGLGLGLTVAKLIVELHDGTLRLEPASGGGTTVTLRLPVAKDGSAIA